VREEAGRGLIAATQDGDIRLGNRRWCGVDAHDAGPTPEDGPELWLARGAAPPVRFVFHDQLRPGARETIGRLRRLGLDVLLLSGDRDAAVRRTAEAAGIAAWRAGQRPDQKIAVLEALRGEGHKVLMVGDGLNDAPALAAAHASISPSTAADVSQTSADFVFQGSALGPVADALEMARAARRLVYQNFALAFAYNLITIPLAMAGQVTPLVAAAAMSASSIVVTVNALRLRLIPKVLDIDS
jgi:Cu2+-exporting ATPase